MNADAPRYVFIYYSGANTDLVRKFTADLTMRGVEFWIDKNGLQPGMPNWESGVRNALEKCSALLYIVTPESRDSRAVKGELAIAEMQQRRIVPVWLAGDQWANTAQIDYISMQYIDARGAAVYLPALDKIVETLDLTSAAMVARTAINSIKPPARNPDFEPRNPFKGLKAFDEADQNDFFGREDLINDLLADVAAMKETRFLALVGASGSGKSSVIRAGLLPRLRLAHPNWVFLPPMLPGATPLKELMASLFTALGARGIAPDTILDSLQKPNAQALDLYARALVPNTSANAVLVVDQFEELFIQTAKEERRQFISLLTLAASEARGSLIVIVTLRADFYDRPLNYEMLARLIEKHTRAVTPLTLADLKDAS